MELHQLRYLVAIAKTGNFSRAAEECHVAQPSLSQQIRKLEDELGERLFDRMKREARLTPAGEALLPRAVRILDEVETARREAHESGQLVRGTLRIGALPTIAPYFLPDAIRMFSERYPGVEMVVEEDTTARLLRMIAACEIDLAIASLPLGDDRLETRTLFSEELLLALPPDHRLAGKSRVALADVEAEKFILLKEGHCLGDQVVSFCQRRDVQPAVSLRSAQMETIQALVRSGLGVSLIPRMAVRENDVAAPVYRRLDRPRPERAIVLAWLKSRPLSRAGSAWVELLAGESRRRRANA